MTAVLATLFFLTSLGLSYLFSRGTEAPASVMDRTPAQQAPVDPLRFRLRPHPNPRHQRRKPPRRRRIRSLPRLRRRE